MRRQAVACNGGRTILGNLLRERAVLDIDLSQTSICQSAKVFTDKQGDPILIKPLTEKYHQKLIDMYLAYRPRNSFEGLPPISDEACVNWVKHMINTGINLVALSFDKGMFGHSVLFPMDDTRCEMLIVVTQAHQNCGIGNQLIHCIIQLAYEIGFQKIWLSVSINNFIAKHLYSKCGFEYLPSSDIDQVEMLLDLQQYLQSSRVKVDEVMNREVISVHKQLSCKDAIDIFLKENIGSLPVVNDDGEVISILSETDLIIEANVHRNVNEVLTREVITVQQGSTLDKVIRIFQEKKVRCIPVLDRENKLVGVLGRKDILSYYAKSYQTECK